jgi:alpha-L-rhamnosidase
MKKIFVLAAALQCLIITAFSQVSVENLLIENKSNPISLDVLAPRLSWQLVSNKRNTAQTAYEIKLSSGKKNNWNSGIQHSNQSVQVVYTGPALESNTSYQWQVRVWDQTNTPSEWSQPASFTMGMLKQSDWKAQWIEPGAEEDPALRPSPLFRKTFTTNKKIVSATAYITAHGIYEAQINGQRVGDAYLTPGWTSYNKRLQYQAYDVTNMLTKGKNAIGVSVGSGWYRGSLAWEKNKNIYGKDVAVLLQINIVYSDGTKETIVTNDSWKSSTGAIRYSEIYNGETVDARLEKKGWSLADYDDKDWANVKVGTHSLATLIATENEPVKKQEVFHPVKIFTTPKGERVIDFGQNLVGWVTLKASGKSGDKITLLHAEVLDKYGNFYTENLRAAKCKNEYILKGGEVETFEPHFTWQGFRYVKIEGYPGEIKAENFSAVALYSNMPSTGSFNTSNTLINQLQHNIQWGQNGNFLDVPTDCPQRDERLGWTGDAQVFSRTASFNRNVNNFFSKWVKDIAADQFSNGSVPHVIPNVLGDGAGSAGWADVSTIVPWNMYLAYADKRLLDQQYNSMKAWVGYMKGESKNGLWNTGSHFGDWLSFFQDNDVAGKAAITDKYLIAQCFYAFSTQLVINAATVLGKTEDVKTYTELLQTVKNAFLKEYVSPNGRLVSGTQTAYTLALHFDMLPENLREQAVERLVGEIKKYNTHLNTGFLGTPYLCHVLSRFGKTDIAYKLLLQEKYPSWLYPVKMGATTIWERWNGIRPDSSFEPASMNSFNHYAYGAIGDWMYRVMVGIDTYEDGVGYQHIKIQPHIGGDFSFASASLKTYYGTVSSGWKITNNALELQAVIPNNTRATVYIPAKSIASITENGQALSAVPSIVIKGLENEYVVVELGSGTYQFSVLK